MTYYTYLEADRENARQRAREDFAAHEITVATDGGYRFARSDTLWYGGSVILHGKVVVLYGDIGELMFLANENARPWLETALHHDEYSCQYLAKKVPSVMKKGITEVNQDLVKRWAIERVVDLRANGKPAEAQELYRSWKEYSRDPDGQDPYQWWYEVDSGHGDVPNFECLTWHFLYQCEFLRHFVRKLSSFERRAAQAVAYALQQEKS